MGKLIVLYRGKPTYKRVLFRYAQKRNWRFFANWKCNFRGGFFITRWHWSIILPFLRFTKCNGQIELGLGNHYIEFGW